MKQLCLRKRMDGFGLSFFRTTLSDLAIPTTFSDSGLEAKVIPHE